MIHNFSPGGKRQVTSSQSPVVSNGESANRRLNRQRKSKIPKVHCLLYVGRDGMKTQGRYIVISTAVVISAAVLALCGLVAAWLIVHADGTYHVRTLKLDATRKVRITAASGWEMSQPREVGVRHQNTK